MRRRTLTLEAISQERFIEQGQIVAWDIKNTERMFQKAPNRVGVAEPAPAYAVTFKWRDTLSQAYWE